MSTATFESAFTRTRNDTPRITLTSEVIDYWAERIADPNPRDREHVERSSIIMDGDKLFHYGRHFELGRIVRKANGRPKIVLLNGDSYSGSGGFGPSTASRQADTRRAANEQAEKVGVPVVVIPFSAVGAAGVELESMRPLEIRPDRRTTHERSSAERPGDLIKVEDPSGAMESYEDIEYGRDPETGVWAGRPVTRQRPVMVLSDDTATAPREAHGWPDGYATLGEDGRWHWTITRHWLGECLFRGKVKGDRRMRKATPEEVAELDAFNLWTDEGERLRRDLGDKQAKRADMANLRLAYDQGTAALDAAPCPTDAELESALRDYNDASQAFNDHHYAKDAPPRPKAHAVTYEGHTRHMVNYSVDRWATFLSSFDYAEPHAPYFMCELRYGTKATTVDEAIDDLMPAEVRAAVESGLDVLRQGDVFAIPTSMTTDELKSRAQDVQRQRYDADEGVHRPYWVKVRRKHDDNATILGTNHQATHVIVTKDGDHYGRGRMYHTPGGWRQPDHRQVKLGDGQTWYRFVKNTVPLDKASGSSRGSSTASVAQSGQSRAWTAVGTVD